MNQPKQPTMPKVTNMPAPPPQARPNRAVQDAYADEALRAAQRHIDQVQEIDRLGQELEEWRRRAMMAESEIKRLEKREQDLLRMLEEQTNRLTDERDNYRMKLNDIMAQFHTAGAIILKCIEAGNGATASPVSMTLLANQIDKDFNEANDPMPNVVKAGPIGNDGEK